MGVRDHRPQLEDVNLLSSLPNTLLPKNGLPGVSTQIATHATATGTASTKHTPALNTMSKTLFATR